MYPDILIPSQAYHQPFGKGGRIYNEYPGIKHILGKITMIPAHCVFLASFLVFSTFVCVCYLLEIVVPQNHIFYLFLCNYGLSLCQLSAFHLEFVGICSICVYLWFNKSNNVRDTDFQHQSCPTFNNNNYSWIYI